MTTYGTDHAGACLDFLDRGSQANQGSAVGAVAVGRDVGWAEQRPQPKPASALMAGSPGLMLGRACTDDGAEATSGTPCARF
jgi:hypothetical protein